MRTTFPILVWAFIICFSNSSAAALDGIILNPRETSVTQRILSYKNYDDIRIDRDLDGQIDEWYVRKGDMHIHVSYKLRRIQTLEITKFTAGKTLSKKFQRAGNKFLLVKSENRPMLIMHGDETLCDNAKVTLDRKVSSLAQDLAAITGKKEVSSIPSSCNLAQFPQLAENLSSMGDILRINSTKITDCLEKAGNVDGLDMAVVSAKFKLILNKIADGNSKEIYSCEMSHDNDVAGQATEDGKIKFLIPSTKSDPVIEPDAMVPLFFHEILHASGVKSEETARSIIKSCSDGKPIASKSGANHAFIANDENVSISSNNASGGGSANTLEAADKKSSTKKSATRGIASATTKSGDGIDMKSEIANAEAIIPSAEKLNVASTNKSPAGKEQALRESVSESAPVFRMANQAMGASSSPAYADSSYSSSSSDSSTYSSGSSSEVSGSGSSRSSSRSSTGERYQSRSGRYQSKDVGSDEFVSEEVDLTKNVDAQTARNRQKAAREPAAKSYQSDTQTYEPASQASGTASRGPASATDETSKNKRSPAGAKSADASATVGGSTGSANLDTGSAGGSSGSSTASSNKNQRAAKSASASRAPASANQGSPAQRRELMSTLVDDNYVLTKRKLKDQSFQDELTSNGITVIDTLGSRWGAPQGTVIYLDNGDKFVRQR